MSAKIKNTSEIDWLKRNNAQALAHKIRNYWAERGRAYDVTVELFRGAEQYQGERSKNIYAVRSNIAFTVEYIPRVTKVVS